MPHFEKISYRKPKVEFSMDIINKYNHKETKYWDDMDVGVQYNMVSYFNVPLNNPEADLLCSFIDNKNSKKYKTFKIKKIERIQNPYLMADYLLMKDKYFQDLGQERVTCRWGLHGTKRAAINNIAYFNFDLNNAIRHRYGKGIYFATDISFAAKFCDHTVEKKIIVANILQGITCQGHEDMQYPSHGDTSLNKTENGYNVIVKYDDSTYYPAYIVTFNMVLYTKKVKK